MELSKRSATRSSGTDASSTSDDGSAIWPACDATELHVTFSDTIPNQSIDDGTASVPNAATTTDIWSRRSAYQSAAAIPVTTTAVLNAAISAAVDATTAAVLNAAVSAAIDATATLLTTTIPTTKLNATSDGTSDGS
jgi:hypothetical protein